MYIKRKSFDNVKFFIDKIAEIGYFLEIITINIRDII